MKRFRHQLLAAATALLWAPGLASAEAPPLIHAGSAYADAKGAALREPEGIACTDSGRVVTADTANGRLVMFTYKDGAFSGGQVIKFDQLGRPTRVQIDSRGNVLVLDQRSRRIVRVGQNGEFGGYVELKGVPAVVAPSFVASFKLDATNNLYVLDVGSNRVIVTDPNGGFLRALPLPRGGFITDIAVDRGGTVLAVDGVQAIVYEAQRGATEFKAKSQSLKEYMNFPSYLATGDNGRLVLVDKNGNGLVVVGPEGKFQGRQLSIGWNDGLVYYPGQICLTRGLTFVADRSNHRIQAFIAPAR